MPPLASSHRRGWLQQLGGNPKTLQKLATKMWQKQPEKSVFQFGYKTPVQHRLVVHSEAVVRITMSRLNIKGQLAAYGTNGQVRETFACRPFGKVWESVLDAAEAAVGLPHGSLNSGILMGYPPGSSIEFHQDDKGEQANFGFPKYQQQPGTQVVSLSLGPGPASFTQKSFERPIGAKDWRKETYTGKRWKVTRTLQAGDLFAMPASDDRLCLHAAANGDEWRWVLVMRQVKPAAWRFFSKNWPYYMVLNAKERQQGKAKQPVALPSSFAPSALGIAGSVIGQCAAPA